VTVESYYSIPIEDYLERIEECLERKKVVKAFIQTSAEDDEAWKSELMTLLCEYYSINCRYTELMHELLLTPPFVDEATDEELVTVDVKKYSIMASYSKLLIHNEVELKYKYKISLLIH
jgi:hypothetical protein